MKLPFKLKWKLHWIWKDAHILRCEQTGIHICKRCGESKLHDHPYGPNMCLTEECQWCGKNMAKTPFVYDW